MPLLVGAILGLRRDMTPRDRGDPRYWMVNVRCCVRATLAGWRTGWSFRRCAGKPLDEEIPRMRVRSVIPALIAGVVLCAGAPTTAAAQWFGWNGLCHEFPGIHPTNPSQTFEPGNLCLSIHAKTVVQGSSTKVYWESLWNVTPDYIFAGWGGIGIVSFSGATLIDFRQWFSGNPNEWYSTEMTLPGAAGPIGSAYFEFYSTSIDGTYSQNPLAIGGATEVTPTPEPGTVILVATGLLALIATEARRRQLRFKTKAEP